MKLKKRVVVTCASAALSACGGGGGNGGGVPPIVVNPGPTPTPAPSPTPTPTPSPTPSPSPSGFPVVEDSRFLAFYAAASFNSEALTPPPAPVIGGFGSSVLVIDFGVAATPDNFTIEPGLREGGFRAVGRSGDELIGGGIPNSDLRVLANIAGAGVDDPALRFRYSSYAIWTEAAGFETFNSTYLFGYPTLANAAPTSGTRTLNGVLRGRRLVARTGAAATGSSLTGVSTVTVNFGTGQVRVQMQVNDSGPTIDNSFPITAGPTGTSRFEGALTGAGGAQLGNVRGGLFGPAAEEAGLVFTVSRSDAAIGEERIAGVVLAK